MNRFIHILISFCLLSAFPTMAQTAKPKPVPPTRASKTGESITTSDGLLKITNIGQLRGYNDPDVRSPKSAGFSLDGKKLYVNSLEGFRTVVYDGRTREKKKVIHHDFESGTGPIWSAPSGYYTFTHYPGGEQRSFLGKPVEQALTPDGRYLFVPYYRRNFDINAQDPSAMAVIDTHTDDIVRMFETGPLPKMVKVSNNGKMLAITHWGDNTVGFMDISDPDPKKWRHLPPITIGHKLDLNYSLTVPKDRDSGSGYSLRGTVFLPGDSLVIVGGMGGHPAIIDVKRGRWLGFVNNLPTLRHIVLRNGMLYMSNNAGGEVLTLPVSEVVKAVRQRSGRNMNVNGVRRAKVGAGARTLEVSPDGRHIFVACNTVSALYIVNAEKMETVGSIPADSYPVGLDIAPTGDILVTTSQARQGRGGNAVDIFSVEYLK